MGNPGQEGLRRDERRSDRFGARRRCSTDEGSIGKGRNGWSREGFQGGEQLRRKDLGNVEAAQFQVDEFAGYGELIYVHLAIRVRVGECPGQSKHMRCANMTLPFHF